MLDDWKAVHDHEPLDGVRMVHGGSKGDKRTPVVAYDREAIMVKVPHERHDVAGHRPL